MKKRKHKSKNKDRRKKRLSPKRGIYMPFSLVLKLIKELPEKDCYEALGVYLFVKLTGIYQDTNQPYCIDNFIAAYKDPSVETCRISGGVAARHIRSLIKAGVLSRIKRQDGTTYLKIEKVPKLETVENAEFVDILTSIGYQIRAQDKDIRLLRVALEESEKENKILRKQLRQLFPKSRNLRLADSKTESPKSRNPQTAEYRLNALSNTSINTLSNTNNIVNEIDDDVCSIKDFFDKDIKVKKDELFYYRMSIKLYDAAKSIKRINKRSNIRSWSAQFKKLNKTDKVKKKLIKKYLLWYIKHIEDDYMPEAFCGKTFREKFDKIVNAKKRKLNKPKKKKPKPYKPKDENDDYEVETKEWTNKDGQVVGEDIIDYED